MGDTPINVAYPAADDLRLRIALGACLATKWSSERKGPSR